MLSGCAICVQTETLRSKWTRASLRGRACEEVRGVDCVSVEFLSTVKNLKLKSQNGAAENGDQDRLGPGG